MIRHSRIIFALERLASIAAGAARAEGSKDRLTISKGSFSHVIYDDGREDVFSVTRRRVSGHDDYGRRIWRRTKRGR